MRLNTTYGSALQPPAKLSVFGAGGRIAALVAILCAVLAACATQPEERSVHKIGKPYQVKGKWYYPKEEPDYDEVGYASWYGKRFHGLMTSNGERFDMNKLSAAHRTLPMPSMVRVTNIQNGRSLVVRLNDRGPFADDRIIDVSRAAAMKLGFLESGVAQVRVQYVGPASLLGDEAMSGAQSVKEVQVASASEAAAASVAMGSMIPPAPAMASRAKPVTISRPSRQPAAEPEPEPAPTLTPASPPSSDGVILFVQVASLSSTERASGLKEKLASFGSTQVSLADVGGKRFYRVRVGPMTSRIEAESMQRELAAGGYADTVIVSQ